MSSYNVSLFVISLITGGLSSVTVVKIQVLDLNDNRPR